MRLRTFIHSGEDSPTTLSELNRAHDWIVTSNFIGAYAYATQSGLAAFNMQLRDGFWNQTSSRWLFGIDYGRTQPQALRDICAKPNAEVRICDGAWVVAQIGFVPRRDFHAKASVLTNQDAARFGMVVGSGNFSSNGLRKSIEAGTTLLTGDVQEYQRTMRHTIDEVEQLWNDATPANVVLDEYEEKWSASFARGVVQAQPADAGIPQPRDIFWIEAGYVTQNRGLDRPGNQIDLPRGMSRYFGFDPPDDLPRNSIIGEITFDPPRGDPVSRNLRLGNNLMEKITLPIPEEHGFDIYDGKVLVFQRAGPRFVLRALEAEDFEAAFGDKLSDVKAMGSGRRYGHID